MGLPEELLRGIHAFGFEKPSAIQQRAIKPTMLGCDLIAQAQSGTVSFCLFFIFCDIELARDEALQMPVLDFGQSETVIQTSYLYNSRCSCVQISFLSCSCSPRAYHN
jgi:hypothetical protein